MYAFGPAYWRYIALDQKSQNRTTPMEKAIFEGVSINNSPSTPGHLMNSKTEYKQGEVARVVLVRGLGQ